MTEGTKRVVDREKLKEYLNAGMKSPSAIKYEWKEWLGDSLASHLVELLGLGYFDLSPAPPKPEMCGVCLGQPLPSGRECICEGVGTLNGECDGLRKLVYEYEKNAFAPPPAPPTDGPKEDKLLQEFVDAVKVQDQPNYRNSPHVNSLIPLVQVFIDRRSTTHPKVDGKWEALKKWVNIHQRMPEVSSAMDDMRAVKFKILELEESEKESGK